MKAEQTAIPRYLKIAVDLSARIASGDIAEGERLKGRSVLSTEYNVSPETIRRAVSILSDKKVVRIALGSGIVISSKENAIRFLKSFKDDETAEELRVKLFRSIEKRDSMDAEITSTFNRIIELYKFRRSDLITPVEIELPRGSHVIGRSIGELEVWHNTGATIIGIIQDKKITISPGPYYEFASGDRVLIVGDENVVKRFHAFINGIN